MASFSELPSELIVRIMVFLADNYQDVINVGATAREIHACSLEHTIWRALTLARWKYSNKNDNSLANTDWRTEFKRRHRLDAHVHDTVDKLIYMPAPPNNARIPRFREVDRWYLDSKDALLMNINCGDDIPDVLARRFWAKQLLSSIYRRQAVQEWRKIFAGEDVPLERALATFDMFIRQGEEGDFASVSRMLDEMTEKFKTTTPEYAELSPRGLALQLAHYLVVNEGFTGNSQEHYYDVPNNFIGFALERKEGMPLIYVAIFCAMAKRLGLTAAPCSFPSHVFAVVLPPEGIDLNGKEKPVNMTGERMFIDLYSLTTLEITEMKLRQTLDQLSIPATEHDEFLEPASSLTMMLRMRRNMVHCMQIAENTMTRNSPGTNFYNLHRDSLYYMILWMTMVFDKDDAEGLNRRRGQLGLLISRMEADFPGDWYLFQEQIVPLFRGQREFEDPLNGALDAIRQRDLLVPSKKPRTEELRGRLNFKIGTCFTHKKYGYTGMIVGWDPSCEAPSSWQSVQQIHELSDGAGQCFYNIVDDSGGDRYIAQENIGPMPPSGPPSHMLWFAGRYFLRWDTTLKKFISNLTHVYPDD